jgi:lipid A ethanolaminephosphotransferase
MLAISARRRPLIRIETLVALVCAWLVATANGAWWHAVNAGRDWSQPANWLFLVACFAALSALHFALLAPLANRWSVRPLLTLLVIVSAGAAWYMRSFAVILDPTMIQNVLRTDAHEARDLLSFDMVAWVVLWSAIPVAFIWLVRLERRPPWRALGMRAASVGLAVVLALASVLLVSRDLTSFMRNERAARYLITPGNYLYGLAVNSLHGAADARTVRQTVGADAHLLRVALAEAPPRVFVLVLGETARAQDFSLLGYPRETNPELAKLGLTAFGNVKSCGTSTEVSVPCMFSPYGRADYDERKIKNSEGLLDVLVRAGYRVKWIDNQSGCKGVCKGAGVEYEKTDPSSARDICDGSECRDEILVRRLAAELPEVRANTVFVLHMMGNHGPAYFKRYPAEFRRFLPDCTTAELRECTRPEIVNAYDNAILYTDHVLSRVVQTLEAAGPRIDGAMLYVSDHGESLGENGLYLHGIPYAIAPEQQTHVPMLVWLSSTTTQSTVARQPVSLGSRTARRAHAGVSGGPRHLRWLPRRCLPRVGAVDASIAVLILRDWRSHVLWPTVIAATVYIALVLTLWDRPIARAFFYDPASGWLGAGAGDWWAHGILHSGGRWLVRGVALAAALWWLASFRVARLAGWRREALYVFVGMVAATALVGLLKLVTNVDCPWDLTGFGGVRPYFPLFSDRPDYLPRAACFPGAHSSSGFALMSLYFALRNRRRTAAYVALGAAITVGIAFSIGQEARGAHFLSHDFVSAALVWFVLLALYEWLLAPRSGRR